MKTTDVISGINYKGEHAPLCGNCHRHAGQTNSYFCSHCGAKLNWKKYHEEMAKNEISTAKETNKE